MADLKDSQDRYADWWSTSITQFRPNEISMRGYPIEDLIGRVSFPAMVTLMIMGELPSDTHSRLLEAAMVASVDHGPQAPSIAIARMAATCGVPFNGIIASGVSVLGDVHGGAGQQCISLFHEMDQQVEAGREVELVVREIVQEYVQERKFIPGFGHRFHKVDPRAVRLYELLDQARNDGQIDGHYMDFATLIAEELSTIKGRQVATNIDGATAVVYSELGFSPEIGRALFILSRSVGLVANAWEEMQSGSRLKGPLPKDVYPTYLGHEKRRL